MKIFSVICTVIVCFSCGKQAENRRPNLITGLTGSWTADAFSGELRETWAIGIDGWPIQEGFYIENGDTSYSAQTKVEQVGNEVILFSVIKGSNPKIFQAVSETQDSIIFQNSDYGNPFEVIYRSGDANNYSRSIRGYESDSLVTFTFHFTRVR